MYATSVTKAGTQDCIQDFPPNVFFWGGVGFFEGRNEILLLGEALKFGVIYQNMH